MKRWAFLTVLLYAAALLLLTVPVVVAAFNAWGSQNIPFKDILSLYGQWQYWLWLAVLVGGQFVLLLLPIHIAERRLPARRPLKVPILVTAFFLANLGFAGVLSLLAALFKENGIIKRGGTSLIDFVNPIHPAQNSSDLHVLCSALITLGIFWLIWALIFRSYAKADNEATLQQRSTRWLLRGSILELIVAVPSHVIVRRREDCCAPIGTFWGIATGISVMLLCFGPGVYFLFVKRSQSLRPKPSTPSRASD
jgi:hypothetical protein